ncbi:MAG: transposase, partial [Fretibacterium sp.]|nr:transposase [Fretibacterium sp.]
SSTGTLFSAWVEKELCPVLRGGDLVVMDNLSCHKVDEIEPAIRGARASLLYLPTYNPDLHPIEKMWSKIKAFLRGLGLNNLGEYEDRLMDAVRNALHLVTVDDAAGWSSCCGYSQYL